MRRLSHILRELLAAAPLFLVVSPMPADAQTLLTWPDLLERPRPKADATITYGPDLLQRVDLWSPSGPGPHPVVLMVHGGCWTSSIADRSIMNWIADDLRAGGVAVWNIDYRGVDRPGGAFNGIFADVGQAGDLLREHADAHRLDVSRVVAVGHSAGGHLALWLAARPRLGRGLLPKPAHPLPIAHVVSLGGLPDLEQALDEKQGCGPEPIEKLFSPGPLTKPVPQNDRRELLRDRSIPLLAPLGVPQTLVNGDADRIIPTRFAIDYAAKMRAAGDAVDVRIMPDQGHVELIAPESPAWAEAKREILKALGLPSVTSAWRRGPASSRMTKTAGPRVGPEVTKK
jgi:acetyl esterase/lipase